jgi:hypothetical protein
MMLTTKEKRRQKQEFAEFAESVVPWLTSALEYLETDAWTMSVDANGVYQPGKASHERPDELVHETQHPRGRMILRIPAGVPNAKRDLDERRERLHYVASIMLIGTIGTRATNAVLADVRDRFGLTKIRTPKGMRY